MRLATRRVPVQPPRRNVPVIQPMPVAGLNLRDPLVDMPPIFARELDNWIAEDGVVKSREGHEAHATTSSATVTSLMPFQDGSARRLFAATADSIFDATNPGAVGSALVTSLSNGIWTSAQFGNLGTPILAATNGADGVRTYTTGGGWVTSTITGVTPDTLDGLIVHQSRGWAFLRNTLDIWYFDNVLAFAGGMTELTLKPVVSRGGSLAALASWSRDNGTGMDDHLVAITDAGEIVVYAGTDPNSPATFSRIGTWPLPGRPVGGTRCAARVGGDLWILTEQGIASVFDIVSGVADATRISSLIAPALAQLGTAFQGNSEWGMLHDRRHNRVIINCSRGADTPIQYVMPLRQGGPSRMTGMPARCWAEHDGSVWFGDTVGVRKGFSGVSDLGSPIMTRIVTAPNRLGTPQRKRMNFLRLHYEAAVEIDAQVNVAVDYEDIRNPAPQVIAESTGPAWNTSPWNTTSWGSVLTPRTLLTPVTGTGTVVSFVVDAQINGPPVKLTSSTAIFEVGNLA